MSKSNMTKMCNWHWSRNGTNKKQVHSGLAHQTC